VGEEPEDERKDEAEEKASHDGEINCGVFAAVDDVAGKSSEAERQFAAEEQKNTDGHEEAAEVEERAAEFAERVHESIIEEDRPNAASKLTDSRLGSRPTLSVRLRISQLKQIQSNLKK
jgi:hypothetical protein